jgi:release factor glutamine methyltransferase
MMSTQPQSLMASPDSPSALASELLETGRSRPIGSIVGRLLHRWARLRGHHRYDDWRFERWRDLHLVIVPTVSNPRLLRTGVFFAEYIESLSILPVTRVLDLGTGSGICALVAARRAARVTAVDINPAAVRCVEANALMNELQDKVDARQGDLFSPVRGERFDLVFFNPPFLLGRPRDARDAAWRGSGVAEAFAAGLKEHLRPDGVALVLLSSWGDACPVFVDELARRGYTQTVVARRYHVNETVTILEVTAPP